MNINVLRLLHRDSYVSIQYWIKYFSNLTTFFSNIFAFQRAPDSNSSQKQDSFVRKMCRLLHICIMYWVKNKLFIKMDLCISELWSVSWMAGGVYTGAADAMVGIASVPKVYQFINIKWVMWIQRTKGDFNAWNGSKSEGLEPLTMVERAAGMPQ